MGPHTLLHVTPDDRAFVLFQVRVRPRHRELVPLVVLIMLRAALVQLPLLLSPRRAGAPLAPVLVCVQLVAQAEGADGDEQQAEHDKQPRAVQDIVDDNPHGGIVRSINFEKVFPGIKSGATGGVY